MAVTAGHEKADVGKITTSIVEICDHLMTVVRLMMKQLHPLILTELGLKATLEDLLHHWQVKNPAPFLPWIAWRPDRLDRSLVIQVFRVIQESLTNIIRHAEAGQVTISLKIEPSPDTLFLAISDDGVGCDLVQLSTGFG